MKLDFKRFISEAWMFAKRQLNLPLPLKNHFYKGRPISVKRNWFCRDCDSVFHLLPWKKFRDESATGRECPICGSKSVVWSTFLFMAIVDKKPKEYLHWLSEQTPEQIFKWISKYKAL